MQELRYPRLKAIVLGIFCLLVIFSVTIADRWIIVGTDDTMKTTYVLEEEALEASSRGKF